jgi:diaminopropionate ammonia-lyase
LQAGVGGLAGACAALFRDVWGDGPFITVVEPEFAPAIYDSIQAGGFTVSKGPVSDMGRLDCKEASLIALKGLSRDADAIALISEEEAFATLPKLAAHGLASSTSGSAGITAALLSDLPEGVKTLCILSEGT